VLSSDPPAVLCVGIAVQDIVFRVERFPPPGGKTMTHEFMVVCGGCAVNAAIAVARLGGRASFAGPLGDPNDSVSNQLMSEMAREGIGTAGVVRIKDAAAPVSGIMVDDSGERMIATYRDRRIEQARAPDPDALVQDADLLLADNRFPAFVRPICEAARRRGIPVLLDADRPTTEDDPLFAIPTHVMPATSAAGSGTPVYRCSTICTTRATAGGPMPEGRPSPTRRPRWRPTRRRPPAARPRARPGVR
jgi:sugar/nucleoside kinase (ribokinase family)